MTIYPILGMTLRCKVILKVCRREFSAGLLYTGCSRVTNMDDLAIFGYDETEDCFPKIMRYEPFLKKIYFKFV